MTTRNSFLLLVVAVLAGTAGWFAAKRQLPKPHTNAAGSPGADVTGGTRKIAFYQSAMHPWIRSDRPGKCTICGMALTPVFEGEAGLQVEPGLVTLSSNAITVLDVRTAEIQRGPLTRTLRVAGTIADDDSRHRFLTAYTGGRIEELFVDHVGAEVGTGQPLATFYSPMLLEAERQFLAVLRQPSAGASLGAETGLLRDAAFQRLRQLGVTEAQIESLPRKSPTQPFSEILAPAAGTVVARFVYAGQYVMEGEKLFELADFSTMWFQFDAYEQDLPWIEPGQEVEVTTPSVPGRIFRAPIRFIDPNLAEMTRSARVRVEIPNPVVEEGGVSRRLLRHRLYAEGRVAVVSPEVVRVPRSAVLSPAGQSVVYVDQGGVAYGQRNVTLGRFGDAEYEVLSGLAPGERVVVHGNLMIDAQAQLNQAIGTTAHSPPGGTATDGAAVPAVPSLPPLNPAEARALAEFLAGADHVRAALAADDLNAFNTGSAELHASVEPLEQSLGNAPAWQPLLRAVTGQAHLARASDLRAARQSYLPLSLALVELAKSLRTTQAEFKDLRIYRCPMTAESFDGAPRRAEWLQLAPPLRNPWFGSAMLDCGTEIRP